MSDTAAALRAAREVQADTLAPELYRQASALFFKAKQEYKIKNFLQAKELALQAQKLAEEAEFEALRSGGLRQSESGSGFETEIRNPTPPPPPPKPKSPRDKKNRSNFDNLTNTKDDALLDGTPKNAAPQGEFIEAVEEREAEKKRLREIEAANKNNSPPPPPPAATPPPAPPQVFPAPQNTPSFQ